MNFNDEEREAYEDRAKWLGLQASALKKKEQEGVEKGIEIGKELGKAERDMEIARTMLKAGYTTEQITQIIKLAEAEIEQLGTNKFS